jgi:hypothetical protein
MNIISIQNVEFDDATTLAMGEAFDKACTSLRNLGSTCEVREIIAKRIIAAAKNDERDPLRLSEYALVPFGIEDVSMVFVNVGLRPPLSRPTLRSREQRDLREPGFSELGSHSALLVRIQTADPSTF